MTPHSPDQLRLALLRSDGISQWQLAKVRKIARFKTSRPALERVADAVIGKGRAWKEEERILVNLLRNVTRNKRAAALSQRSPLPLQRKNWLPWHILKAGCSPTVLQNLLQRIDKRLYVLACYKKPPA